MSSKLNLIFDFDGTLVDSFDAVISIFNTLADEFHFLKVQQHEITALKDLTSKQLIKYFKIPLYKIPLVIHKARKLMHSEMDALLPFANLREALQKLRALNINLGILTSNSEENVSKWLRIHKMDGLFHFIHGGSSLFGKKGILKRIIKSRQLDKAKTFYMGDETRDIEAAKECGVNAVAVTWGFNSEKILAHYHPHFILRDPDDLLSICT